MYRNDDKITLCNINHIRGSSATYVKLCKLFVSLQPQHWDR